MPGRYRRKTREELARIYQIPIPPQLDLPIFCKIAPTQRVLAIRYNRERQRRSRDATACTELQSKRWSFRPALLCIEETRLDPSIVLLSFQSLLSDELLGSSVSKNLEV
jgi:hypothetical protein